AVQIQYDALPWPQGSPPEQVLAPLGARGRRDVNRAQSARARVHEHDRTGGTRRSRCRPGSCIAVGEKTEQGYDAPWTAQRKVGQGHELSLCMPGPGLMARTRDALCSLSVTGAFQMCPRGEENPGSATRTDTSHLRPISAYHSDALMTSPSSTRWKLSAEALE